MQSTFLPNRPKFCALKCKNSRQVVLQVSDDVASFRDTQPRPERQVAVHLQLPQQVQELDSDVSSVALGGHSLTRSVNASERSGLDKLSGAALVVERLVRHGQLVFVSRDFEFLRVSNFVDFVIGC